jgi:hypothetical protein
VAASSFAFANVQSSTTEEAAAIGAGRNKAREHGLDGEDE